MNRAISFVVLWNIHGSDITPDHIYGPFKTHKKAVEWGEENIEGLEVSMPPTSRHEPIWEILPVLNPKRRKRKRR